MKQYFLLLGVSLATLMVGVDLTITNIAVVTIQAQLSMSLAQAQWLSLGFGLPFAALLILCGKAADKWGRKKSLLLAVLGFFMASLLAGSTLRSIALIAARVLQGMCAAMILPSATALIIQHFSDQQRGRALGFYASLVGIGLAIGPLLGSYLLLTLGWHGLFLVNLPVCGFSFLLVSVCAKESSVIRTQVAAKRLVCCVLISLASLVASLSLFELQLYRQGLIALLVCLICVAFGYHWQKNRPLLFSVQLFKQKSLYLGLCLYCLTVSFSWPILFYLPFYLQQVKHFSLETTGWLIAAMTGMTLWTPLLAGFLFDKIALKKILPAVYFLIIVSLVSFTKFDDASSLIFILLTVVVFGMAWGFGNGLSEPVALTSLLAKKEAAFVSGLLTTVMNLFAMGLMVLSHLFNTQTKSGNFSVGSSFHFAWQSYFFCLLILAVILAVFSLVCSKNELC